MASATATRARAGDVRASSSCTGRDGRHLDRRRSRASHDRLRRLADDRARARSCSRCRAGVVLRVPVRGPGARPPRHGPRHARSRLVPAALLRRRPPLLAPMPDSLLTAVALLAIGRRERRRARRRHERPRRRTWRSALGRPDHVLAARGLERSARSSACGRAAALHRARASIRGMHGVGDRRRCSRSPRLAAAVRAARPGRRAALARASPRLPAARPRRRSLLALLCLLIMVSRGRDRRLGRRLPPHRPRRAAARPGRARARSRFARGMTAGRVGGRRARRPAFGPLRVLALGGAALALRPRWLVAARGRASPRSGARRPRRSSASGSPTASRSCSAPPAAHRAPRPARRSPR